MSTGLQFDADLSSRMEAQYLRPQMVIRRAHALKLADPKVGEHALDVGCGPGFLTADLAAGVGSEGSALGIDQSESMVELAKARCARHAHARIEHGDATALPTRDGELDLAISTQVLEYVADVDRALAEIARSLKPGGRALILATDWRAVAWHASDEERMQRMLAAWEEHLAHPTLPRTLARRMREAGLAVQHVERHSVLERADDRMGYSAMLTRAISDFAPGRCGIDEAEARAWVADLEALRQRDEFHFSLGQYFFGAVRR